MGAEVTTRGQRAYEGPRRYRDMKTANPSKIVKKFHDNQTVSLRMDDEGFWYLTCDCPIWLMQKPGKARSCPHVVEILRNGEDVTDVEMLDVFVLVTCSEQPDITARISLGDPDLAKMRSVVIMVPNLDPQGPPWKHDNFLGFIHQAEGRAAIRRLVLEWIVELEAEQMTCGAPHHVPQGSPWENKHKHRTTAGLPDFSLMADLFDLYMTGHCRRCTEDSGVPQDISAI